MTGPRLNRQLVLEAQAQLPDGSGGFTEAWQPLGTLWAEVTTRTGRERAEVGGPVSTVSYKIVVRAAPLGHPARPVADQRFREGTRLFRIQAVAEHDPEGRYLTCFADEEVVL